VYGAASDGLYKSTNAGATWRLIRPNSELLNDRISPRLAISPADHHLLYLAEPLGSAAGTVSSISRSTDGGLSWETASDVKQPPALCQRLVTFLIPHPTDPLRLFSDLGCYAGRNRGTALVQSRDGGATWSTSLPDGQNLYPERLVGGSGVDPQRWYLTTAPFMRFSTPGVYRSDDDGASWTPILQDPAATNIGGLTYNPDQPDQVFVATGRTADPEDTGVRFTCDGGTTWVFLGSQGIGWVNDLVRLPDGTLLAATNEGVWRLAGSAVDAACP
jgi:photosystem II stability/assembly factor-like uncharacterized protein